MAKEQLKCPDCPAIPAWMTTFSDLMSLLLTFFILLLSFSSVSEEEFKKAMGALTSPIKLNLPLLTGKHSEARPTLQDAKTEIEREIQIEQQQRHVEVFESREGIIIRISDRALFDSGHARLKEEFIPLLGKIGSVLARMPNLVEIEGHTDNVPIRTEQFPNNYWLSSARALNVLDVFHREVGIAPERLSAIGYGEFRPLVGNDTPEGRAINRRVEIKVRHTERHGEASPESVRQLLDEAQLRLRQ
jgi:chemotaxis protein MotB